MWGRYDLRNEGDGQDADSESVPGSGCVATVNAGSRTLLPGDDYDPVNLPWVNQGNLNQPPPPGLQGAGYGITLQSDRCEVVLGTESPEDFVGVGNGELQDAKERGNLTICAGCVRSVGCEGLVE